MPISSPPVLDAKYEELGERTEKLAEAFTKTKDEPGWVPPEEGAMDMGRALIRVFEKMARHAIDRINRVPDRSMLAFLDRIGVTPAAARAARVPLTFSLVARGESEPIVPGRTHVGAKALPGDTREIVFETERDLRTTRAKLSALFVCQPNGDRLADHTAEANGKHEAFFAAFEGGKASPHMLYLAADEVLGLAAGTKVTFAFAVDDAAKWQALHAANLPALTSDAYYGYHAPMAPLLRWTYWNGTEWSAFEPVARRSPSFSFMIPEDMAATSVHGRSARWIRGELLAWPEIGVPELSGVTVDATQTQAALAPDAAVSNGRAVDLSLDFYPFGEQPRRNDSLLIACDEVLSRHGAQVTVNVALNQEDTKSLTADDKPVLTWEISTGTGWHVLFANLKPTAATTNDVLRSMTFTVPENAAPTSIGNTKAVWLRIRLSSGSFGKGLQIKYNTQPPTMSDDGYRPPIVKSITLSSQATIESSRPLCTSEDDFVLVDRSFEAPFPLFTRSDELTPALYIGFDRAFSPVDTYLYFQVAPLDPVSAAKEASAAASGNVAWEYLSSKGNWTPLVCEDETRAFATSGLLRFVGPEDLARQSLFGKELFWIRARYTIPAALASAPPASPRLGRVLTNTIWARDAIAHTDEILGSADGREGQSFTLAAKPVLDGERIEVREPSSAEKDVWECWEEVSDFYTSKPQDRHYTLDRASGLVRFGDGRRGMAPPRGTHNVRAAAYATGGGADGNRPAQTVTQLKTTVPYVDGVTNHEPATGGADADTADDIKEWGPSILRHGYRAVTAQDFEDLALEASPAVARARVITPEFDPIKAADNPETAVTGLLEPGAVVLLIAAHGPDMPPAASTGLLKDVDAYIRARSGPAVALRLAGPSWIEVSITKLSVTASSASGLDALRDRIERALYAFFHPITGNMDGAGWAFGALPHESDVYRLVMSIPGVDRVGALTLTLTPFGTDVARVLDDATRARALIYPGSQHAEVFSPGGT